MCKNCENCKCKKSDAMKHALKEIENPVKRFVVNTPRQHNTHENNNNSNFV